MSLVDALTSGDVVIAAELRPPRAELGSQAGMDAWIDTYHAVRGLARRGLRVFLTDSAVGAAEEDNLRHLVTNLGTDVPRECIVGVLERVASAGKVIVCTPREITSTRVGAPPLSALPSKRIILPVVASTQYTLRSPYRSTLCRL